MQFNLKTTLFGASVYLNFYKFAFEELTSKFVSAF